MGFFFQKQSSTFISEVQLFRHWLDHCSKEAVMLLNPAIFINNHCSGLFVLQYFSNIPFIFSKGVEFNIELKHAVNYHIKRRMCSLCFRNVNSQDSEESWPLLIPLLISITQHISGCALMLQVPFYFGSNYSIIPAFLFLICSIYTQFSLKKCLTWELGRTIKILKNYLWVFVYWNLGLSFFGDKSLKEWMRSSDTVTGQHDNPVLLEQVLLAAGQTVGKHPNTKLLPAA